MTSRHPICKSQDLKLKPGRLQYISESSKWERKLDPRPFKTTEIESGIIDSETYRMRSDNMRKKARCKLKRVSIPPERGISEGSGRKTEREKCWHNYNEREKKRTS